MLEPTRVGAFSSAVHVFWSRVAELGRQADDHAYRFCNFVVVWALCDTFGFIDILEST
jgi:hypothetical protein